MELKRLFDLLEHRKTLFPDKAVFAVKKDKQWHKISIDDYINNANAISYALLHLGVSRGDRIAMIVSNRPEWNFVDMGVQQVGAALVPIYPTISEDDYCFILNDCLPKLIIVDNESLLHKLEPILSQLPEQPLIYLVERKLSQWPLLDDLVALGTEHPAPERVSQIKASIGTRDLVTMIYTSGTTGNPKGVMLCHENILTCVFGVRNTPMPYFSRAMSFLPLCHIYERMMCYLYQYMGYEIYYAESLGRVADNIREVRPHMMTAVPRFIEKMYDGIYRKGEKMKGMSKNIFYWALNLATQYDLDCKSFSFGLRRFVADLLVYRKIRASFGGSLEMIVSGGSAIQPRLARFFTCINMNIYEGYGLTETSPVIAVSNSQPGGRKLGTAGMPLDGIEVRVIDGTNEIVCRGKTVMLGYYNRPDLTAQAIDADGWFHTGDTGAFEPEGQLRITGRTKSMFKTSMGKFVNPETLESKFKESPFVLDMMVVGENQKFAAAIILPDFNFLKEWQERHGIHCNTHAEMLADQRTIERYQKVVEKYNAFFGKTEQIHRYKLIDDDWTVQNGCLTPTLKVKRTFVSNRWKDEIEALFK